ncbi:NAD(P)-binding protein [Aspergillus ellipticus CBS 707.79]|uniref:D-xylose 1-dehydrogenase (NADP(+), D-xylono-1,5-lactone-forming) n=1 Tax=Aspergillus ellipticus CBS 707.79 TaxID=1448320 RepID=A0A319CXF2_9EURO|nr:NAD(P)-binding protein [Aspergillus ellipticus CBS 707.79]
MRSDGESPFCLRWGILVFGRDLLFDPATRDVAGVSHALVAVASSRSDEAARRFIAKLGAPASCAAYGGYEGLVADPNVDAVYVASPHSHHHQNAMLAPHAGKHARRLVEAAREQGRFLMEGMWTRFLPIAIQIRQHIQDGAIGPVLRMSWRGGALMDLGVYSIHWGFQALHLLTDRRPSAISSTTTLIAPADVDESTTIGMTFPGNRKSPSSVLAIASASLRATADPDGQTPVVRIQGDRGEIQVYGAPWCPSMYRVIRREQAFGQIGEPEEVQFAIPGGAHGLCFEADEAARCIRDGRTGSAGLPWKESLEVMDILDAVRRANGLSLDGRLTRTPNPKWLQAAAHESVRRPKSPKHQGGCRSVEA